MNQLSSLVFCVAFVAITVGQVYTNQINYLPNALIQDFINRIQADQGADSFEQQLPENLLFETNDNYPIRKDIANENELIDRYHFQTRNDVQLPQETSLPKESLGRPLLFGNQYVQGGAGEGSQLLRPDGSISNIQVIKSDAVLPAYCNPPNPCPVGYNADDGCLNEFENSAQFSKEYQAAQRCMCDSEHMFNCRGNNNENALETLARSIQNRGIMDNTLDKIMDNMEPDGQSHKVVAKKFFPKRNSPSRISKRSANKKYSFSKAERNPFLSGPKLPVVAKKSPHLAKSGH